jgi:chorismate mutase / prephenate dehydratase
MGKEEIRKRIDEIDAEVLDLLSERAGLAKDIAQFKKTFYDPARERAIFERLFKLNNGPLKEEHVAAVYREILSACRSLQQKMTVAFLGPRATFSHSAAIERFGTSINEHPCEDIATVFDEVEKDLADFGVVPFENSSEGVINYTMDRFTISPIKICGEIYSEIAQNLLSKEESLAKVTKIFTQPKALEQCAVWIQRHAHGKDIVQVDSTALAAQRAAKTKNSAAIASRLAAEIYGLKIIERSIEDFKENKTRFLVIGKEKMARTGNDKTSILFSVRHEPGTLYRALKPFEKHELNLTMMQARPSRKGPWEYVFFVDVEGYEEDEPIKKTMKEMHKETIILKTIGSYPAAAKQQ